VSTPRVAVESLYDEEIKTLLALQPIVLLPIGAVESHGDHLPAGTDNILARRLVERLIERLAGAVPTMTSRSFLSARCGRLRTRPALSP
jgi:creatinine amidohydrolase/Fe(II)-dependent formamide hydrolase-like protein